MDWKKKRGISEKEKVTMRRRSSGEERGRGGREGKTKLNKAIIDVKNMLKKKDTERKAEELGSQFPQAITQQLRHDFGGFGATTRGACLKLGLRL